MMKNIKIKEDRELSLEELLKRIKLMEQEVDSCSTKMDHIKKTLENKFMWELNLNGIEMLRGLK